MVICPEASSAQNSMAAVSAQGSTVSSLDPALNSSCNRSIAFEVRIDFHWLGGNRVNVNSLSPASLPGCRRRRRHLRRHLRMNALPRVSTSPAASRRRSCRGSRSRFPRAGARARGRGDCDACARCSVGQPCRSHSAATAFSRARRAVDDDQLRRSQSAPDEIVRAAHARAAYAFPAHALDREQHLLAVGAHAATSNEIEVALLSSRTRATVPSRISRTIGSSASERAFQASQSPFLVLRQTRLTTSLPTGPASTAFSTRVARGGCWSLAR